MIVFAREPIFDSKKALFAYQLVFRDGDEGSLPEELITAQQSAYQSGVGLNALLQGYVSLISISHEVVFAGIPDDFFPQETIIEVKTIEPEQQELLQALNRLRKQGYRIAMSAELPIDLDCIRLADYIKVDINSVSIVELRELQKNAVAMDIQIIATGIETHEEFEKCIKAEFDYFQGHFFLARKYQPQDDLPASRIALLDLLGQTSNPQIDMERVRNTFEQDATLSYLLLRFINNPLINKSHRITSIKHAITYLGEVMLRKFVAIISIAQLNQGNAEELLQVSLVRAKYCELIDAKIANKQDAMSAFMVGLFSLLDVILDRDMAILLGQVQISESISDALLTQSGEYCKILSSIKALESSNWLNFKSLAQGLDLSEEVLHQAYQEAVNWNNDLHHQQSTLFPKARP
ncbi:HDOD domain-containing protein [Glaciecola sp. XM2]|jgi:EAL and modified HD-GYP domain-containing signal transduction protein|uniref:EAL and HDOD domain-containing protein n=1 Tax=Glaciecola sp. XM2 TaxID=1914931 RepID=UPI001BDEF5ED|nr:HDOD domain-containing protein [Glaciecola sp. XM2]MBT1452174.1 HDOD domain-containing protein [Glaciecola sp. XM2]